LVWKLAGKVIDVGPDVDNIAAGDRVVYGTVLGAYAQHRNAPAASLIKIPDIVGVHKAFEAGETTGSTLLTP